MDGIAASSMRMKGGLRRLCRVCVVPPRNRSNRSNPTCTQLWFRHGLRVRRGVRGFETFPNALGYTATRDMRMKEALV